MQTEAWLLETIPNELSMSNFGSVFLSSIWWSSELSLERLGENSAW